MKKILKISEILFFATLMLFSCKNEYREDYYGTTETTVNTNVWEAIQQDANLSAFVQLVKLNNLDTLFAKDQIYTLFIPTNSAFAEFVDTAGAANALLEYCISEFYIQSKNVQGLRKIQTLGKKYALFNFANGGYTFDNVPITFESPLYLNGKYFKMDQIAYPKLNLYEYFALNNVILKNYIDEMDSLILDKTKSRPLGFDSLGNTVYDTVAIEFNEFEAEYFPVKHESRYKTATFVFPIAEDYNKALTQMALSFPGIYTDYKDIPLTWQNKYLIPYLLEHGVFENLVEEQEFVLNPAKNDTLRMKNILGDSVDINYTPTQKTLCSNGYAYNYSEFKVPDTLWKTKFRFEAEHLVRNIGANRWSWKEGIKVDYTTLFEPTQYYNKTYASKDSSLEVKFSTNYRGVYSMEFNVDNLFPRKYLMVIRTNLGYGGKYNIYVNDLLVKNIDYASFTRGVYVSPNTGIRYLWDAGKIFISFDCYITNLTEYGKAKIRFEYLGPSTGVRFPGLSIDYIDFKPSN